MARYFFDMADGNLVTEDTIGLELTDVPAARERATELAISQIGETQAPTEAHDMRELRIRAAGGHCVARIALRYVSS